VFRGQQGNNDKGRSNRILIVYNARENSGKHQQKKQCSIFHHDGRKKKGGRESAGEYSPNKTRRTGDLDSRKRVRRGKTPRTRRSEVSSGTVNG